MSEKNFQKRVKDFLETIPRAWFYKSNDMGTRGIPDYIVCINGKFVALELKSRLHKKSRSRGLQEFNINRINKYSGFGFIVAPENWDEIKENLITLACKG